MPLAPLMLPLLRRNNRFLEPNPCILHVNRKMSPHRPRPRRPPILLDPNNSRLHCRGLMRLQSDRLPMAQYNRPSSIIRLLR